METVPPGGAVSSSGLEKQKAVSPWGLTAFTLWAHQDSNLGPLPCEGSALPLSYAPDCTSTFVGSGRTRIRTWDPCRVKAVLYR